MLTGRRLPNFWTGARVVSTALVLSSCLSQPLPETHFKDSAPAPSIQTAEAPSPGAPTETKGHALVESIVQASFARRNRSQEEALIELLVEPDGTVRDFQMSLEEIRFLQERYAELAKKKAIPADDEETPPKTPDVFRLKKEGCEQPTNDVKRLENGLRYVVEIYRAKNPPCFMENSSNIVLLLNELLAGHTVKVALPNSDDVRSLATMADFRDWLDAAGFEISAEYRTYLASFIRLHKRSGDLEDASSEIPLPLWVETGAKTPAGTQVVVPASHSEILFRLRHRTLGRLSFKIHFSGTGFVFHTDEAEPPHWTGMRTLHAFGPADILPIFENSKKLYEDFNVFEERFGAKLKMRGFGLLGVCNDGVAILVRSLYPQELLPFPMVRTDLVQMPDDFPLKSVWDSIPSDSSQATLAWTPEERYRAFRKRLLVSDPFHKQGNPFPDYEALLKELAQGGDEP